MFCSWWEVTFVEYSDMLLTYVAMYVGESSNVCPGDCWVQTIRHYSWKQFTTSLLPTSFCVELKCRVFCADKVMQFTRFPLLEMHKVSKGLPFVLSLNCPTLVHAAEVYGSIWIKVSNFILCLESIGHGCIAKETSVSGLDRNKMI